MRYLILKLSYEYGNRMLVIMEAPTVLEYYAGGGMELGITGYVGILRALSESTEHQRIC